MGEREEWGAEMSQQGGNTSQCYKVSASKGKNSKHA